MTLSLSPHFICRCLILSFTCAVLACSESVSQEESMEYESLISYERRSDISQAELRQYWGNNDTANQFISHDLQVYSVKYKSTDADGVAIELSGAVLVPMMDRARGILSLQHATFFDDNEAPSVNQGFSVVTRKAIFASHGYITLLPDYLGYGSDSDRVHPYHHAKTLASASHDFILASRELFSTLGLKYNEKLFLAGYSEGAYATAALQQRLEKDNSMIVSASSIGAGAYNIKKTVSSFLSLQSQDANCSPCNAFFLQAYDDVYTLNKPMDYYFLAPYADLISDGLLLGEFSGQEVNQSLPSDPSLLFSDEFVADYLNDIGPWSEILNENSIHDWTPKYPVLVSHGRSDNVSPFFNSEELAQLNSTNSNFSFQELSYQNHFEGIFPWGIITMLYFDNY